MIDIQTYPEGEEFLLWFTGLFFAQDVVDFGCGNGRLAPFFSKRHYVGWDASLPAIVAARAANPGYVFNRLEPGRKLENGYVAFAYDTLLHVPDERLESVVQQFGQKRVVVSEVLGRDLRTATVFNREVEEYERPFRAAGYRLHRVQFKKAEAIVNSAGPAEISMLEFHKK